MNSQSPSIQDPAGEEPQPQFNKHQHIISFIQLNLLLLNTQINAMMCSPFSTNHGHNIPLKLIDRY